MSLGGASGLDLADELKALRAELAQMRTEQRAMADEIAQLVQTFRSLATSLGIAAEPYRKGSKDVRSSDLPGFA
jgi:hypothetical protein